MKDLCFVSLAFGSLYVDQINRLKKSILAIFPEANAQFYIEDFPSGSRPFGQSLYGFKPHAIAHARKQFSKVIWLDPAMVLVDRDLSAITKHKLVAVKDDHKLNPFISDQALKFYGITRHQIESFHLVGGSLYYFDFDFKVVNDVFDMWLKSEQNNLWDGEGQTHTGATRGHRSDEALMALAMFQHGLEPQVKDEVRYCNDNPAFIKLHFK
jgi:hypothetical protein